MTGHAQLNFLEDFLLVYKSNAGGFWEEDEQAACMHSLVPRPFPPPVFDLLHKSNQIYWRWEQRGNEPRTRLLHAFSISIHLQS